MRNEQPLPHSERSSDGDVLGPAEHEEHMVQRRAEQGTRTPHGYLVAPTGPPRGAVVDRYLANVRARRAERAAETAPNVVVLPDLSVDPPADSRVADPDDDLGWEAIE